ncbi:MAG TPA: hydrogenase nickel incorporation protein HypB [Candidatus Hydrogenedentes bacterium]|nr:hydrogenase nickel incorporation protein HypB [Candidatus Hydrogenedentota bacterium]
MEIRVVEKVLKVNDELAQAVRDRLRPLGVATVNMISAPGSGKTTLIERAVEALGAARRIQVIEGDPDTTLDAERIAATGAPVVQINTAGGCHLEANLVLRALEQLDLAPGDLLVIENVGNLVCPVSFDLGEDKRVAVVSVTEGHDKPAKYPKLFRCADLVVLNKIDLLPHVDFDVARFREYVEKLQPGVPVLDVSCRTGEGVDAWADWLRALGPADAVR